MSDPFSEHRIRKARQRRENNAEDYTPIVLWVNTDDIERKRGSHLPHEQLRQHIRDSMDFPFTDVLQEDEPEVIDVVTEFSEDED